MERRSGRASFRVNGVELGLGSASRITIDAERRLTAEVHAAWTPPTAQHWMLAPPMLYLRGVTLPSNGRVTVDDELLDEHDIGLYVGTHCDVMGQLEVTDELVSFSGDAKINGDAVWRLEVHASVTA